MSITNPAVTTVIALGQSLNIEWTAVDTATRYELSYSVDGGNAYSPIVEEQSPVLAYAWPEVRAVASNWAKIRVEAFQDAVSLDQSEVEVVFVPFLMGVVGADVNTKGSDPVDHHDLKWELQLMNPTMSEHKDQYGNRTWFTHVQFDRPFARAPQVIASMAHFDICHEQNPRFVCEVQEVSCGSFKLQFRTFADTLVYGGTASWIALGMLPAK